MRIRIEATELEDDRVAAIFVRGELKAQCGNSGNITVSIADGDQLHIEEMSREEANAAAKGQAADDEKQAEIQDGDDAALSVDYNAADEPADGAVAGTIPEAETQEGENTNPEQPSSLSTEPGDKPEDHDAPEVQ